MFQLITEQPLWFIVFCLLAGLLYAFLLYRGSKSFDEGKPWLKKFLFLIRTIVVSVLCFFLLSPLLRSLKRETEKPIIIVALDESKSIVAGKDSSYYKNAFANALQKATKDLSSSYEVKTISFGDKVNDSLSFSFNERETNFTELYKEIELRYSNRNIGAIVLASDGLYNAGGNPLLENLPAQAPVITIALGDTTMKADAAISNVRFNKNVFLGNSFPVEVDVTARQLSGSNVSLTVSENGNVLSSRQLVYSNNRFSQNVLFTFEAKQKGLHHFTLSLSKADGESNFQNNLRDIYFEVSERSNKILLLADAPHPDISAIKSAIDQSLNFECTVVMAENFQGNTSGYSAVVLHNLPSVKYPVTNVIGQAKSSSLPLWYIVGLKTNLAQLNNASVGVSMSTSINRSNDVLAAYNDQFSLFTTSEISKTLWSDYPPLTQLFGNYKSTTNNYTLFYQQSGSVKTQSPLWCFNETGENKTAVLCGEGLWRWRLNDFSKTGNFDAFNEPIIKTIQFLCNKENRERLRLITKNSFDENEPIVIDAEVFNKNFELVNDADLSMTITNSDGKDYRYSFSKTESAFTLNAGTLPAGNYTFKASVKQGDETLAKQGYFSIAALQSELAETMANHQLMYALAQRTGGEMIYPNQVNELKNKIAQRNDIKTVSYSHYDLQSLLNLNWIFFLIMSLLTLEWFLRKRNGAY